MGLPRSIPSGGAGLDTFSEKPAPQASRPASNSKPSNAAAKGVKPKSTGATQRTQKGHAKAPIKASSKKAPQEQAPPVDSEVLSEFEEFQRWKQMKEAGATQQPTSSKKSQVTPTKSVQEEVFVDDAFESTDNESTLKTKIDPKTGIPYYEIPKTKMGSDGKPILEIDIDIYDLNGEAEAFMAHLRIPPSKEEREALLAQRAEIAKQQRKEKEENDKELEAKYGSLEQEVDPFNEKSLKKRGLFKKKS